MTVPQLCLAQSFELVLLKYTKSRFAGKIMRAAPVLPVPRLKCLEPSYLICRISRKAVMASSLPE